MIDNTWAVVTGGSDGIGLAISKKLAREGFNICIVSRTQSKIEDKLQEITKECRDGDQSFKTLCIVADFSKMFTIEEYQQVIGSKLADLDVGVVILNAGMALNGFFNEVEDSKIEQTMQINTNHVIYMTKVLLP